MFCALNGATLTPWRCSQRQMPGGHDRLAGVGVRAADEQRALHRAPLPRRAHAARRSAAAAAAPTASDSRAARRDVGGGRRAARRRARGRSRRARRSSSGPPSRTPSAPAKAASMRPAFGLGCAAPSRRSVASAAAGDPPTSGAHSDRERRADARGRPAQHVVEPRGGPAELARSARCGGRPSRRACSRRGTRRRPRARDRAPQQRADDRVAGVLGDRLHDRPAELGARPADSGSRPHSAGKAPARRVEVAARRARPRRARPRGPASARRAPPTSSGEPPCRRPMRRAARGEPRERRRADQDAPRASNAARPRGRRRASALGAQRPGVPKPATGCQRRGIAERQVGRVASQRGRAPLTQQSRPGCTRVTVQRPSWACSR